MFNIYFYFNIYFKLFKIDDAWKNYDRISKYYLSLSYKSVIIDNWLIQLSESVNF